MATVLNPFTYIADPVRGRPVFNGQVYFGRPDTDPVQPENRINIRAVNENGTFTTLAQPVRTGPGGIALNNGNPAQLDLVETEYSFTIQDSQGVQRFYSPRVNIFGEIGNTLGNIEQFRTFGVPRFITASENNGTPFPYDQYARVVYDDGTESRLYESRTANNTRLPTVADDWFIVDQDGLNTENNNRFLQTGNNLDDLNDVSVARQNLELVLGQANDQIPRIGNPATAGRSAVVVNTGRNANGNFRVYSDGLMIQYGTASGNSINITLPVAYSNTNYRLQVSNIRGHSTGSYAISCGNILSATQINIQGYFFILSNNIKGVNGGPHHWLTIGT